MFLQDGSQWRRVRDGVGVVSPFGSRLSRELLSFGIREEARYGGVRTAARKTCPGLLLPWLAAAGCRQG